MTMLILPYTIQVIPNICTNFKILVAVTAEKSLTKNFIGEKEKWTNKQNGINEYVHTLLNSTTSHAQCLY